MSTMTPSSNDPDVLSKVVVIHLRKTHQRRNVVCYYQ